MELVGNTPLLQANRYAEKAGITKVNLFTKLEYFNPAGSVKDRIGLAAVAAAKGYQAIFTLPETMSVERRNLLKAYGAKLELPVLNAFIIKNHIEVRKEEIRLAVLAINRFGMEIIMKKKLVKTLGIMLSAMAVFSGCGTKGAETAGKQDAAESKTTVTNETADTATEVQQSEQILEVESITFIDDLGREVIVDHPQRVAVMLGSFADVWMTAGGEVVAAPSDTWTSLNLNLGEDVVNIGSFLEPDVEQLIAAAPDFVIASANTDGNLALEETFENAGITVAYFSVSNFSEYLHMLEICTQITGREDLYEKNGLKVQEKIEEVKSRIDGSAPTVLFLRASSTNVKAKGSEDTVGGEILADLGCVNIADSEESLLDDLSMEAIITADPEYIFVTTQGNDTEAALAVVEEQLFADPAWNSLSAVQEGRYYVLDKSLYNLKPNARWGEAYEKLADILYPAQ